MANTLILGSGGIITVAAGNTRYICVSGASNPTDISETSQAQVTWRSAGTLSKLYWHIPSGLNTLSGSVTLRVRIDGANGNQFITVSAAGTGDFYDDSGTDSVTAGQKINYSVVADAGTGSVGWRGISMVFAASSNTVCRYVSRGEASTSLNTTYYRSICSEATGGTNTVEARVQSKTGTAGTLKNLFGMIDNNTIAAGNTIYIRSRINGGNGNLSIPVNGGTTGIVEDTTNSDSLSIADYFCTSITTPNVGSGAFNARVVAISFESTNSKFPMIWSAHTGTSVAAQDEYIGIAGGYQSETTEAYYQLKARMAGTAAYAVIYTTANRSQATNFRFMINGVASALVIPCSTSTGEFSNTTDTASFVAGDTIYWEAQTGGGSGNFTFTNVTVTLDAAAAKTGRITATQADLVYNAKTGRVTATQADTVYNPKTGRITATQGDAVYNAKTGRITATQSDLVYDPKTGRITATQGDTVYSEKTGRITAIEAIVDYPLGRITATQADLVYNAKTGRITALQSDLVYDPKTGRVTAVQADVDFALKTGRITATQGDVVYNPKTGRITAVEATVDYPLGRITATQADLIYSPKTGELRRSSRTSSMIRRRDVLPLPRRIWTTFRLVAQPAASRLRKRI